MRRRSNLMVLAGIAFFVVGAAIVFFVSRNGGTNSSSSTGNRVDVLVAKATINAGAKGNDVITKGLVEVKQVPSNNRLSDALITPNQLSNATLTRTFAKGEQITQSGLSVSPLTKVVTIPDGFEALAVSTDFVSGGAGYIAPGDLVNVYLSIGSQTATSGAQVGTAAAQPLPFSTPHDELLLTNVRVLDVSTEVAPLVGSATSSGSTAADQAAAARSSSSGLTLLLAVSPLDSEKLVFATNHGNHIYLARVASDKAAPVQSTPGRDYYNIFQEEPGTAQARSGTASS